MAGGWGHIVDDEGHYEGSSLLENGGDVEEFAQEVYGMVWYLAKSLEEQLGGGAFSAASLVDEARQSVLEGWKECSPGPTQWASKRGLVPHGYEPGGTT